MKRGHVPLSTTLRPEEAVLLDKLRNRLETARVRRARHPETYRAGDNERVTIAGVNRAALRYVLEHQDEFVAWLDKGNDR